MAFALREECWRRGAIVFFTPTSSLDARRRTSIIPVDTLAELPDISACLIKHIEVRIFIGGDELPDWKKGLEHKLKTGAYTNSCFTNYLTNTNLDGVFLDFRLKDRRDIIPKACPEKSTREYTSTL
jgi:hypothetical protein